MLMGFQEGLNTAMSDTMDISLARHSMCRGDNRIAVLNLKSAFNRVARNKLLQLCAPIFPGYRNGIMRNVLGGLQVSKIEDCSQATAEIRQGVT